MVYGKSDGKTKGSHRKHWNLWSLARLRQSLVPSHSKPKIAETARSWTRGSGARGYEGLRPEIKCRLVDTRRYLINFYILHNSRIIRGQTPHHLGKYND